jgi:predicted transcriptional regulator of viral defense system
MKDEIRNKIISIFIDNHGYSSTGEITDAGIHHKYLHILEDEGTIEKVKRGLYVLANQRNESAFIDIANIVPKGIICLASALSYYELTTYEPLETEIAIDNKRKIVLPETPPIHLYYFSKIKIYDKEKTICDLIFYRNKIGKDIMREVLSNYTRMKNKNISKLFEYAKKLRNNHQLKQYMEVLI